MWELPCGKTCQGIATFLIQCKGCLFKFDSFAGLRDEAASIKEEATSATICERDHPRSRPPLPRHSGIRKFESQVENEY